MLKGHLKYINLKIKLELIFYLQFYYFKYKKKLPSQIKNNLYVMYKEKLRK